MPAARGEFSGGRRKRRTTRGPQGLPIQASSPQRPAHLAPAPPSSFVSTPRPFTGAQAQARNRVARARRRLPDSPLLARVPQIAPERLTAQQRTALVQTVRASLDRARGRLSVRDFYAQASPRDRQIIRHLAKVERFRFAERAATGHLNPSSLRPLVGRGTSYYDTKVGLPFGTVNLSGALRAVGGLTSLARSNTSESGFVKRSFGDVGTLATAPFVGGYEVGAGAYEGVTKGDFSRLGRLGEGIVSGIGQEIQHPIRSFQQHPLLTGLDVLGATSVVGHTAGALARGLGSQASEAGLRGALARAGSTVRSPLALTNVPGGPVLERAASRDLVRKFFQSASDATRDPLRDAEGNVVYHEQGGRKVPVLKQSEIGRDYHQNRLGDHLAARANDTERDVRSRGRRASRPARVSRAAKGDRVATSAVRGKTSRDLVAMATEGTITTAKHFAADLKAERDRIAAHIAQMSREDPGYRHTGDFTFAQERVKMIDRALKDPRVLRQAPAIVAEGERLGRQFNAVEGQQLPVGVLSSAERARGARLSVTKIAHMGGRHFTEADHARLEADALKTERAARDAYEAAPAAQKAQARQVYEKARERRIAVSGRDPAGVLQHEALREKASRLQTEHRQARAKVARLKAKQHRWTGRGVKGDAMTRLEGSIKRAQAEAEKAGQIAREAKHEARKTPMPPRNAGIRAPDGSFLSHKAAEDFLRARGRDPGSVSYLPHRPDVRGQRAYHAQFRPGTRGQMDKPGTRTGELYRKGGTESSVQLLQDHGVRQQVVLAHAEQIDRLVGEAGLRHPAWAKAEKGAQLTDRERRIVDRGGYLNAKEAGELAQRVEYDTGRNMPVLFMPDGERFVPMRAFAAKLPEQTQAVIRDELQGPAGMDGIGQRLMNDRFLTLDEIGKGTARNVVLVPAKLVERLDAHLRPAGHLERMLQMMNRPFRYAVLPQPRWLTGNFVEPYFVRLPGVGSGAVNVIGLGLDVRGSLRTLKAMARSSDPKVRLAAKELRAQHLGGLLFGARGASNRRVLEDFAPYRTLVKKLPVVHTMADMTGKLGKVLLAPARGMFHFNAAVIERGAQHAAFGRQVRREVQAFTGSWLETVRLGDKALEDVGKGLVGTAAQHRFMKAQHELLGKYSGYSPRMRAIVQGPMPFLPWSLNAARFIFWTMPAHRSAQTALLIKTQQVVARQWADGHAGVFPDMRNDLQTAKGGWVNLIRYTPWSIGNDITSGSFGPLANQVLPQIAGAAAAAQGNDPFGSKLKVKPTAANPTGAPTGGQTAQVIVNSLLGSTVPYYAIGQRIREGGGTPYSDSTLLHPKTKPGTKHMSGLRRALDPFRPTYLGQPTAPAPRAAKGRRGALVVGGTGASLPSDVQAALIRAGSGGAASLPPDVQRALIRAGG